MTLTMTSRPGTGNDYLAAARELRPLLREQANAIEAARELTRPVLDALIERRLFSVLQPDEGGAPGATLGDVAQILAELARGDASTAWDVMNSMGSSILGAFLTEDGAQRVFASPSDVVATAVGRMGKAVAVEGGYLVEARWPFLSGSPHATWIGGLCMVHDGDTPRMSPEGQPHVIMPLVRKERVTLLDTWNATGLRGTGSQDAEVAGAFVPYDEVIDFARGPRAGLSLLYSIDENAAAPLVAASVALGIARAAIDSYREITAGRTHQSGVPAVSAPLPQLALATAESSVDQAWAHIHSLADAIDVGIAAGRLPDEDGVARSSLAATQAAETAIAAVGGLYRAAGAGAVFVGSPLERALRDVYTIGAHRMLQRENYLVHGPKLFGVAGAG